MARLRLRHLLLLSAALASARSHGSIFDAVAADSMQKLKAALEADPSALDDGYTPMHGAGFQGRAEIARLLMAHGVDATCTPTGTPRCSAPAGAAAELARGSRSDQCVRAVRCVWIGGEPRHTETVAVFIEAGASAEALEKCEAATRNAATKAAVARAVEASKKAEL
ncbi:hypothetical protein EMIHUDRAFT_206301 [Emiliania huxleyi CCMP1516]|uniref:Ankyrin repeat domain-containing protein n=2 Tax=Emiliania huxleyi TaxID=2903 RepID=A0A0D3JNS4_EMIH1|nr:hypothetical protein EMIHUDRAFT_206301 [Emiliania huxleyi CCMP1516]EOD25159.1 hypothetical protein EMIHUDRAFT_206301 [Emiliania huxleyi CCMP1516]|eukprot:XP_005777588.1 hypothetical protein EMIHUDRAFT_206301 [Emiliania huxleyi CCMP1516]